MTSQQIFHVDETRPWLQPEAGWPDQVPKNCVFPRMTLYEMLVESAERHADHQAVWFLDTFMTYRELLAHVNDFAAGLTQLGLKKGDVAALVLPSCFQYIIAYYACAKVGVIVTGVNPTYVSGEVLHQLKLTGTRAVIFLDALYQTLLAPIEKDYPIEYLISTNVVDLVKISGFKKWLGKKLGKVPTGPVPERTKSFMALLNTGPAPPDVPVSADDIATYIMTGGTTGVPKAAILTHFNCVSNAIQVSLFIWMREGNACMLGILPLFHSFGMSAVMNTVIRSGMWAMLFPRPPETEELLKTICRIAPEKQTYYPGAEVLFQRIADFPDINKYPIAQKLMGCISGAGPLHHNVKERFEKATGAILVEGYGLSEASPVVSGGPLGAIETTGTIGLPLTGIEWKIMDMETGKMECTPGEIGELVVTGPTIMQGYLNNPEETAETIREQDGKRWLYTGDIGQMDELGRVSLSDRKKQLIKVKGYSVFPTEVEQLMGDNEALLEVAVAGLPDPETSEAIKAWVVLREDWRGRITEDELKAWCKKNMSHYKAPKYVEFIDEIPKTLVGKVMRRQLQEADPIYREYYRKTEQGV
jgi:long-chain acyl-CoA synthetase